jgi:hypothetical protein
LLCAVCAPGFFSAADGTCKRCIGGSETLARVFLQSFLFADKFMTQLSPAHVLKVFYAVSLLLGIGLLVICLWLFLRVRDPTVQKKVPVRPVSSQWNFKFRPIYGVLAKLFGFNGYPKLLGPEKLKIALSFLQVGVCLKSSICTFSRFFPHIKPFLQVLSNMRDVYPNVWSQR